MNKIKEVQQIQNNLQIETTDCELLKIQVNNINSQEIEIQGRVDVSSPFCSIRAMKDSTFTFLNKINENGLYTVDVMGLNSVKVIIPGDVEGYISVVL